MASAGLQQRFRLFACAALLTAPLLIRALFNWLLGGRVDQAKPGERLRASKAKLTGG